MEFVFQLVFINMDTFLLGQVLQPKTQEQTIRPQDYMMTKPAFITQSTVNTIRICTKSALTLLLVKMGTSSMETKNLTISYVIQDKMDIVHS